MTDIIYLDNGATSFPKPEEVYVAMDRFFRRAGVNPGRSGYDLCIEAGELLEDTRALLTRFFHGTDPNRLVFGYNSTDALNLIVLGHAAGGRPRHQHDPRAQLRAAAPLARGPGQGGRGRLPPLRQPRLRRSRTISGKNSGPIPAWSSSTTAPTSSARSNPSRRSGACAASGTSRSPSTRLRPPARFPWTWRR